MYDLYIRFKAMYIYHTSIRNMRAHNANVRSFILRYSPPPLVAKERIGAGEKNYNNKK